MKKFLLLSFFCLSQTIVLIAQVPEKFNYQGVLRNASGELITNTEINLQISLLEGSSTAIASYIEQHTVSTNSNGQFSVVVGSGTVQSGTFSTIDWSASQMYLKMAVDQSGGSNFTELGTVQLISVPYAMYAKDVVNKDDADASPTNEIQDINLSGTSLSITDGSEVDLSVLQDGVEDADSDPTNELQALTLEGDTLEISDGNKVTLPYDSSYWESNNSKIYYNTGNVGIGSMNPVSRLEVKGNVTSEALFQVINANNDTVFAVYPDGVKIFVDPTTKGKIGGFAVSGRSPSKAGNLDILKVTPDSTRIYVSDSIKVKGKIGGFAVSGRSPSKGIGKEFLVVTADSTRVYVNESSVKAKIGGFAVSGRSPSKGTITDYLQVTKDSTRVYIEESLTKGKLGGFAVSGRSPSKGTGYEFLRVTADSTRIFTKNDAGGFGVSGLSTGTSNSYLKLTPTNYFIGHNAGKNNLEGEYNSFIGFESGLNNLSGGYNTFMGYNSGKSNIDGSGNIFIGWYSGLNNTSGFTNVFIGERAGYLNADGHSNVYIGSVTGAQSGGSYNTFIGRASGANAMGEENTYIGSFSSYENYSGNENTVVGYRAGNYVEIGARNVFVGNYAGNGYPWNETTQDSSYNNVSIGYKSGYSLTEAFNNVLLGSEVAYKLSTGTENVIIGDLAGYHNSSGIRNVFLGSKSGYNNAIGDSCIFIGFNAGSQELGSSKLYIENSSADKTSALIYGEFDNDILSFNASVGIGTVTPVERLEVKDGNIRVTNGSIIDDGTLLSDFVFEPGYQIESIEEHALFMWKNKHLPALSSAKEIKEAGGYDIVQRREQILEELEKAHIYIEQLNDKMKIIHSEHQKQLDKLTKENQELKRKLNEIIELLSSE